LVVAKRRDAEREDYGESKKNGLLFNSKIKGKMWLKHTEGKHAANNLNF
jgi:hypothetical protein